LLTEAQKKKLSEIVALFDRAEVDLKKSEHLDSNLNIPCINELRYAGYHIAKATSDDNPDENLEKAVGHCKRAIYDANESAVIFLLEDIRAFQLDYSQSAHVITVVHNYIEIKKNVHGITTRLDENKRSNHKNRDKYYESCAHDHDALKEISFTLSMARDEINKMERKDRIGTQRFIIGSLFTVVIIIIGVIKLLHSA